MKIICLLLFAVPLITAKVLPRTGVNDVFDGVEGVIYDVPEYEDPSVSLFKLISRGIMPVYTVKGEMKYSKDLTNKDDKPHFQTDDIKKGLDTVIAQLQEAKGKLENGNIAIYLDIDKSVLYLENLKHHLYLDLHTDDPSEKQPVISGTVNKESSDKTSTDVLHSILRASLKKYLSSDDSIFKSFTFDLPTEKLLSYHKSGDSAFTTDTTLVPYSGLYVYGEQSSAYDFSDNKQFPDSAPSKDQKLPSDTAQLIAFDVATEQPSISDKDVFKYELLKTEMPPVEDISQEEPKVKAYIADDVDSSGKTDQVEEGDKTYFRKKLSWKLSSTI